MTTLFFILLQCLNLSQAQVTTPAAPRPQPSSAGAAVNTAIKTVNEEKPNLESTTTSGKYEEFQSICRVNEFDIIAHYTESTKAKRIEILKARIASEPDSNKPKLWLIKEYVDQKKLPEAESFLKELRSLRLKPAELNYAEAAVSYLKGDQKKSRIRGIGDDYVSDIAAYNALGAVYSNLPEPVRAQALTAYLNQMDNVNYRYVSKKHTSLISEPLAVSDICTARGLYWPGLVEGRRLVYQHQTFTEFERKVMTADGLFKVEEVRNDFTVAYAVLRSDRSSFGADYAKASHPQFLERVIEGIVAMRFRKVESVSEIEHIQGLAELRRFRVFL